MSDPYQASSPQQLENEGKKHYENGEYLEAALIFSAAEKAYKTAGNQLLAAEMANNSSVAYLKAGDAKAALNAVMGTEQIFAAQGDLRRQGMAMGNRASALENLGDLDSAVEIYQQSADILQKCGENELRAHVLKSLSALQLKRGQQIDAVFTMKEGLEGIEKPSFKQRLLKYLLKLPMKYLK